MRGDSKNMKQKGRGKGYYFDNMPHKGEKLLSVNPITTYSDSETDVTTTRSIVHQGQESTVLLEAVKDIIAHEFDKFEEHFQQFESYICKTIEDTEKRFDLKLYCCSKN